MEWSIFDIIGPIMIGPSSSHTAGAANLGYFAYLLSGQQIKNVVINLYSSFAKVYKGHGTDWALLGGLLGMRSDNANLIKSFELAREQKIDFDFKYDINSKVNHPNTVKFDVVTVNNIKVSIEGASIGGGSIEITKINGLQVVDLNGRDEKVVLIGKQFTKYGDILKQLGYESGHVGLVQGQDDSFVLVLEGDQQDYHKLQKYIDKSVIISFLPKLS